MNYSLSRYNYITQLENKFLVYNTFTQALAELDKNTYDDFINLNLNSKDKENFLTLGFWVTYNELEKIKETNRLAVEDNSTLGVVLKMTTSCNFRCPYCYQEHIDEFLDTQKINRIKKFFNQQIKNNTNKVVVHYFGGEPLLNLSAILELDKFLQGLDCEYNAELTTNGYLLNSSCIQKLSQTKITEYQITIDGPERIHNQTRVLQDGSGSFQTIIKNIKSLLSETNFNLTIRFNCSKTNQNYVEELLEYLYLENILSSDRVTVMFQELHNYSDKDDFSVFFKDKEYFQTLLKLRRMLTKYGKPVKPFGPFKNACSTYRENAFIIGTDLGLECCTTNNELIGHINEEGIPIWNSNVEKKKKYYIPDTSCDSCILLPLCMGGCCYKRSINQCSCIMDTKDLSEYSIFLRDSMIQSSLN